MTSGLAELLTQVLPLALGAAVSPVILLLQMVTLTSGSARLARAWMVAAGAATALAGWALAGWLLVNRLPTPRSGPDASAAAVDLVLALVLVALGFRSLSQRSDPPPAPHEHPTDPDVRRRLAAAFGIGLAAMASNVTTIVLFLPAVRDVARAGLPADQDAVALTVLFVITLLPALLPVVAVSLGGAAGRRRARPDQLVRIHAPRHHRGGGQLRLRALPGLDGSTKTLNDPTRRLVVVCDTMVTQTDDGLLFAKNSDRDPNEAQFLDWRPAAEHPSGNRVRCTWIQIDQVPHTRAVLLSRPWWLWGAEMGANDAGVVIGNEAVFTDAHDDEPGLLGMDLLRLALERAGSAADAVQVIVELLERHGQGGSCSFEHPRFSYDNSFLVADPEGAIVLETAGRSWATEVVTGRARSISNGLTIAGFADVHRDRLKSAVAACESRRAITTAGAARAVGVAELAAVLRSHGDSPTPRYSPLNGAMAAPCMHAGGLVTSSQTTASWISDLRGPTPQHWATATSAPCTSLFKPVDLGTPVDLGPRPTNVDDPRTLWWRHERLHRGVAHDPGALIPRYRTERDRTEAAWFADPPTSAAAFAAADEMLARWTGDVRAARTTDVRPVAVRRMWRRWDRRAASAA